MSSNPPRGTLFYQDPQPLSSELHASWRIKDGNVAFAADALGVPIVFGEFAAASCHYPILFAAGEGSGPIVLTGLERKNLFITDGVWDKTTYMPAYVRRHPFGFISTGEENAETLMLGIDVQSPRIVQSGTEGVALFEDGKPSELTRNAVQFCQNFHAETGVTFEFCQALRDKKLLVDRRIDGTFPDGKKFAVDGFQIIDMKALTELDDATVVAWHRKGWLASAYFHLASLERVNDLLGRRAAASA